MNLCLTARVRSMRRRATSKKQYPPHPAFGSRPGGRFVEATYQALQAQRQSAPLLFRKKAAELALTAVRLDDQPARVQARCGAAQFNSRPMPREHNLLARPPPARLDAHLRVGDGDALLVMAALKGDPERPAEQQHFESGEG